MQEKIFHRRYKVSERVAQGAMGTVYAVNDLGSGRRFAAKELIASPSEDTEREFLAQQFMREADLLKTLSHQSIPCLHDCFIENDCFYLIMDFIDGITLEEHVRLHGAPGLPQGHVLSIGLELCDTLSYLHSQIPPVIFRDLKPANIILTGQNTVVLIDFGIAQALAGTLRGTPIGTEGYAPPEQYRGYVDERSDIFSLGATLHHLISGWDPQQHAPFIFPALSTIVKGINPSLQSIIDRALQREPSMRFASADEMRALLLELHDNQKLSFSLSSGGEEHSDYRIERSLPCGEGSSEAALGHLALARQLLKENRLIESREELREAARMDSESHEAYREMGIVSFRLEMYQDALQELTRALRLNSYDCETSFFLGATLLILDREEEALTCFTRSAALNVKRTEELLLIYTNYTVCNICMNIYSKTQPSCPVCIEKDRHHGTL